MSLPTLLATAAAAAVTAGLAAPPAAQVTAPTVSSLTQLSPVAGPLPQLVATSTLCDGKTLRRTLVKSQLGQLDVSSLASTEAQQITTSSSQSLSRVRSSTVSRLAPVRARTLTSDAARLTIGVATAQRSWSASEATASSRWASAIASRLVCSISCV